MFDYAPSIFSNFLFPFFGCCRTNVIQLVLLLKQHEYVIFRRSFRLIADKGIDLTNGIYGAIIPKVLKLKWRHIRTHTAHEEKVYEKTFFYLLLMEPVQCLARITYILKLMYFFYYLFCGIHIHTVFRFYKCFNTKVFRYSSETPFFEYAKAKLTQAQKQKSHFMLFTKHVICIL